MMSFICALAVAATLRPQLEAVAKLPGEPARVSAAGMTKAEDPLLTIENGSAFDPTATRRRLVIVGIGNDEPGAAAVVAAVRWMKTSAPAAVRREWIVSALPVSPPTEELTEAQATRRWLAFQAPDLVVRVVSEVVQPGSAGLDNVEWATVPVTGTIAALQEVLTKPRERSPAHETLTARIRRAPLDVARLLAARYPETPSISYIPSVSWVNALRLSAISGDPAMRQRVLDHTRPWLSGERKMFGDRIQLTAVAGAMVFAELSKADVGNQAAERLANEAAALAGAVKPGGIAEYGQGWTDDMFMASSILSRTGHVDEAAALLASYAGRLQRPDGLFNHAVDGPAAWGRGNGFAALGIVEALTVMPVRHPSRAALLEIYRRHMAAIKAQQAPDGMWRQVIDDPAAYREETATAMLLTAMARGIRLGWLDRSYAPVVDRAWNGLAAHVAADGTIIDVCTGTGAGPTHRYYFDRAAITGADDRGGAMALLASMEMYEFERK
jgi:Glycosyl Hydrolase Family 88